MDTTIKPMENFKQQDVVKNTAKQEKQTCKLKYILAPGVSLFGTYATATKIFQKAASIF